MPLFLEVLSALAMTVLAALTLLDRHIVRACAWFVFFALSVALTWWLSGFIWLALLELLLGAALTSLFLFHSLGMRRGEITPRGRLTRWRDPVPLTWRRGLLRLMPALLVMGMLGVALAAHPNESGTEPLRLGGLGLVGLGLWAFALHRHLLRRLLAFNVIGTGIFLLLMSLVRDTTPAEGHGLVITGLVIALLGTALGSLLIRRINGLEAFSAAAFHPPGRGAE